MDNEKCYTAKYIKRIFYVVIAAYVTNINKNKYDQDWITK